MSRASRGFEEAYKPFKNGKAHTRSQPITAVELMGMEFEPTRWIVPEVLPEGVTILAGKPKKGKSWMGLGICEAVATGGVAFGVKHVEQGDSLCLALEDNPKRLKKRLKKILDGRPAPERMHLHTEWPRLDEGGAELLDDWLEKHPEARLVVIDTLAKIRKPASGANVYAEDYAALEKLLPLAAKHGVAIVVVHHLRKAGALDPMDEISSSTGLTGGVDGFMILRRTPGSRGPTLFVEGRDIEEPTEYALKWNHNTAAWTIEGDAEEVRLTGARSEIIEVLREHGRAMSPKEIALLLDRTQNNVYQLVYKMSIDGQLESADRGLYTLPAHKDDKAGKDNKDDKNDKDGSPLFWGSGSNKDQNKDASPIDKGNSEGKDPNLINLTGLSGNGAHKDSLTPELDPDTGMYTHPEDCGCELCEL